MLEPSLRGRVAPHRRRRVIPCGHPLLEPAELVLEGSEVGRPREDVLAQGPSTLRRRPLVVQRDARSLLERELAALERQLAGQRAEQRRLAGAVRPGQCQPVRALDLERDAVEENVAREFLSERRGNKNRHGATTV